mmetsp:Transcript_5366/g.6192  ORF Transcript_5366/g.6192 Transcript_5366/m.6192 type:complete len:85 (-) Transcript_5366:123-377(-)
MHFLVVSLTECWSECRARSGGKGHSSKGADNCRKAEHLESILKLCCYTVDFLSSCSLSTVLAFSLLDCLWIGGRKLKVVFWFPM